MSEKAPAKAKRRKIILDELPPYGFMSDALQGIALSGEPSAFWKGSRDEWAAFVDELRDEVAASIWPVHRQGKGWNDGAVKDNAGPMTELELDLMGEWRAARFHDVATLADPTSQEDLFIAEDDAAWTVSFLRRCYGLAKLEVPLERFYDQLPARVGSSILALKWQFQRPRPHLVAYLQGRADWPYDYARSSMTSSMVSGHAFLGCLFGCLVYSWLNANDSGSAQKYREALQQTTLGIGDRRVLAGVHYPSDNIASWIVATRLVPAVVHDPAVPGFLLEALEKGGVVLEGLRAAARQPRGAALHAPLAAFDNALSEMRGRAPTRSGRRASRG